MGWKNLSPSYIGDTKVSSIISCSNSNLLYANRHGSSSLGSLPGSVRGSLLKLSFPTSRTSNFCYKSHWLAITVSYPRPRVPLSALLSFPYPWWSHAKKFLPPEARPRIAFSSILSANLYENIHITLHYSSCVFSPLTLYNVFPFI